MSKRRRFRSIDFGGRPIPLDAALAGGMDAYFAKYHAERSDIRDNMLDFYGARCACCGESLRSALTFDHVRGGGCADIRANGKSIAMRLWNGETPKETCQVLCYNCNQSKANRLYCEHQRRAA